MNVDVVVPTLGRPSLHPLLSALAEELERFGGRVVLVDDRADRDGPLVEWVPPALHGRIDVIAGPDAGPAAARNAGWRSSNADWVAFLDDDVLPSPGWGTALLADLHGSAPAVGGVQGTIHVPLPAHRLPTDWERNVAGLEHARWATADMAFRRGALETVGGFDVRFPRAYREDADLALRLLEAGWELTAGRRCVLHPVRPAPALVSVRLQAGNTDDALMRRLHGPGWRTLAGIPGGRRPAHVATTLAGAATALAGLAGSRRWTARFALAWCAATADFAWRRIAPGPKTPREIGTMVVTSAAIPPAATWWWLRGLGRARRLTRGAVPRRRPERRFPLAVLFDRDGTLVRDVPYNGDPAHVEPVPGARDALDRLRAAGVPTAVISNQSGVARGRLEVSDVEAVNARVEAALGPLGPWFVCPHGPDDGCACRKPAPGLVFRAAAALGVTPDRCVVVGDIGADVEAARAAGARSVLVPTEITLADEVESAPVVAPDLGAAVDRILHGTPPPDTGVDRHRAEGAS